MRATTCLVLPLLAAMSGCPDRTISEVPGEQGTVEIRDIPAKPRRDVDILFLIDNSRSMKEEQDSLKANFHRFIGVLESISGGLPNVHIGVATSDLGTQATDGSSAGNLFGCTSRGEDGALRALPNQARFISDVADGSGGRTRNYTGSLDDTFAAIAEVGIDGCGIEQHLAAIERVLDPTNAVNAGFLRDDAYLAVIVIADEDDCSLAHPGLFAGTANGDEVNFRCTSDGVACDSPATEFSEALGVREDCHPKASPRYVESIGRYVEFLKGLKADPKDVIVAGIVGTTDHFEIVDKAGTTVLKDSCSYTGPTGTQYAYPPIRTADFLAQFPERSTRSTICGGDLSEALVQVSALIKQTLDEPCFEADLLDADPFTEGPQYSCSVVETRQRVGVPEEELRVLPPCNGSNATTCWRIEVDDLACSYRDTNPHLKLVIDWNGTSPGADIHIKANCVTTDHDDGPVI